MRFQMNNVYRLDAAYFAYQQGLLLEYESSFEESIKNLGSMWRDLGIDHLGRPSFRAEVDRILETVDKEASVVETA
jgi:hypothetical protein